MSEELRASTEVAMQHAAAAQGGREGREYVEPGGARDETGEGAICVCTYIYAKYMCTSGGGSSVAPCGVGITFTYIYIYIRTHTHTHTQTYA
jgi:hypothetical protein